MTQTSSYLSADISLKTMERASLNPISTICQIKRQPKLKDKGQTRKRPVDITNIQEYNHFKRKKMPTQ